MRNGGPLFRQQGRKSQFGRVGAICSLVGALFVGSVQELRAAYIFNGSVHINKDGVEDPLAPDHTASVAFEVVGTNLQITLTNTDTHAYGKDLKRSDLITAVFFEIEGPLLALSYGANGATLAAGSSIVNPVSGTANVTAPPTGTLYGGWQYAANSVELAGVSQRYGFGTVGLGGSFNGNQVSGAPGSIQDYALIGSGYAAADQLTNSVNAPLVQSSIVFVLGGIPADFDLAWIRDIRFQYGTSTAEPFSSGFPEFVPTNLPTAPEPTSLALAGIACIGVALRARRSLAAKA